MLVYDNLKKDFGYVEPIDISVIIPVELPQGTKFDIMSIVIQLLNLKGYLLAVLNSTPRVR